MEENNNTLANFDPFVVATAAIQTPPTKRARAPKSTPIDPAKAADKREKARERQRRKRERDRLSGLGVIATPQQQTPNNTSMVANSSAELTPEDAIRRERVRAAARERQRKHRALLKQRKLQELGLAMGENMGMDEAQYAAAIQAAEGQYQMPMPPQHELGHEAQILPHGHTGGQTFAATLLLSFSCSPLLKQHLLRTLHMSNEELASLEPVLSLAFDQWDHARRLHYAEQAAKAGVADHNGPSEPNPFANPAMHSPAYDFRARFHRPLTAPSPFRAMPDGMPMPPPPQASSSATPSEHPNEVIDPNLGKDDVEGSGSEVDSKEQDRVEEEVAVNIEQE